MTSGPGGKRSWRRLLNDGGGLLTVTDERAARSTWPFRPRFREPGCTLTASRTGSTDPVLYDVAHRFEHSSMRHLYLRDDARLAELHALLAANAKPRLTLLARDPKSFTDGDL